MKKIICQKECGGALCMHPSRCTSLTACGGGSASGGSTGSGSGGTEEFSFWLYTTGDSTYYDSYQDNPSLKYALSRTYGTENKSISFDFWVPASGTANDNFSTMIGSGDYADIDREYHRRQRRDLLQG